MDHPYAHLEGTALWAAIDRAVAELEENRDVTLTTARPYVVGLLCARVAELRGEPSASARSTDSDRPSTH